jgi:5-methylcytosine-specific restriction endonuclease McrA
MKKSKVFRPPTGSGKKFVKKRLYDTTNWVEYRNKFLAANPTCYACGTRARVVDHVISAKGDESKFWNITNLIPLCKICHDQVTGLFDQFAVPKTEEKMKWIAQKRAQTETSVRVKVVEV